MTRKVISYGCMCYFENSNLEMFNKQVQKRMFTLLGSVESHLAYIIVKVLSMLPSVFWLFSCGYFFGPLKSSNMWTVSAVRGNRTHSYIIRWILLICTDHAVILR